MDEIVEWLRGVVKRRLESAKNPDGGDWTAHDLGCMLIRFAGRCDCDIPRDTIARCEAETRLIDLMLEVGDNGNIDGEGLQLLASGYCHLDGYKPEWAPF